MHTRLTEEPDIQPSSDDYNDYLCLQWFADRAVKTKTTKRSFEGYVINKNDVAVGKLWVSTATIDHKTMVSMLYTSDHENTKPEKPLPRFFKDDTKPSKLERFVFDNITGEITIHHNAGQIQQAIGPAHEPDGKQVITTLKM